MRNRLPECSLYPATANVADCLAGEELAAKGRSVGKEAEGTGVQSLLNKIDDLVRQGNVRRIVVNDRGGRKILDIPVNAGVIAAAVAPMLTAVSAGLALIGGWHIKVENTEPEVVDGEAEQPTPPEHTTN